MPEHKLKEFKEYIELKIGRTIDNNALEESCGSMKILCIKDVDTYDSIAKSLGITELVKQNNIYYDFNMPGDSQWKIILSHYKKDQFETKYGSQYNFTRLDYSKVPDTDKRTHVARLFSNPEFK